MKVKRVDRQDRLSSVLVRSLGLRLRLASGLEELLVVLLGLDEGILEQVGIWRRLVRAGEAFCRDTQNILSELPKRMARVTASGSPSLTSAAAFHTQDRSEPTLGDSFISGTTGCALLAS